MTVRELEILVNEERVGLLREENDLWQLEYAPQWVASPQGFDLSPALPRAAGLHADGGSNRPVQWYFDNLLPEEALRTVLARESGLPAEDAFGLLAYFGSESAGSLVLRDPAKPELAERGLKPLPLEVLNERIANLPKASLTRDAPKRMSLAGAQHKMLVVLHEGQLFEPLPGTPSTHILKPNHHGEDYPASVVNEYFSMRLAKAVGLDVPAVHRVYAPEPVYVVERFDRIVKGDQVDAAERRHVIDTCQLLNKSRSFKYTAARLETLAQAIERCRSRAAARVQLYRWVVFNLLCGNGDNHLKNISFMVGAGGIQLAPAYDLLCTAAYESKAIAPEKPNWPDTQLALTLGDANTFAGVRRHHVLRAGEALGLAEGTAVRELERLLRVVPAAADELVAEIEVKSAQDIEASPNPRAAHRHLAGEMRLLRAARHVVLAEMCKRLA